MAWGDTWFTVVIVFVSLAIAWGFGKLISAFTGETTADNEVQM